MDIPVFELSSFLHPGETFHLARVNIISRQDLSFHTHDYAELLWIEKGSGYHLVNGERLRIGPGDLIMIRPQDAHTYAASTKGGGITLITLRFPSRRCIISANAISPTAASISGRQGQCPTGYSFRPKSCTSFRHAPRRR